MRFWVILIGLWVFLLASQPRKAHGWPVEVVSVPHVTPMVEPHIVSVPHISEPVAEPHVTTTVHEEEPVTPGIRPIRIMVIPGRVVDGGTTESSGDGCSVTKQAAGVGAFLSLFLPLSLALFNPRKRSRRV